MQRLYSPVKFAKRSNQSSCYKKPISHSWREAPSKGLLVQDNYCTHDKLSYDVINFYASPFRITDLSNESWNFRE